MNPEINEINDAPAALPMAEAEGHERGNFFDQDTPADGIIEEDPVDETEDEEFEEYTERLAKPSKKRLFLAFVSLAFCLVLLAGAAGWFFGIGVFAAPKKHAVDRAGGSPASNSAPSPVTEEEKLKMALGLVADKTAGGGPENLSDPVADGNEFEEPVFNSSVDIPSTRATEVTDPLVIPERSGLSAKNTETPGAASNSESSFSRDSSTPSARPNEPKLEKTGPLSATVKPDGGKPPLGRSLFFGIKRKEIPDAKAISQDRKGTTSKRPRENGKSSGKAAKQVIPFGTRLPVTFISAVYTLPASGGLVRMALTRNVSGENFKLPAGAVLVGRLRGSENKRVFISAVGLIDPKTGGLFKFGGEVMGVDGASGVKGRRRKVKSAWSRVLGGLRDAGAMALGAIGNIRSGRGGTVIISDSGSKASATLADELSGIAGNKKSPGEFIEIAAGTNAFVEVTDLPAEIPRPDSGGGNQKSATGLSPDELAELLSDGSPEKIRAALPEMAPEFRKLAAMVLSYRE